jgi:hypothetical protein
MWTTPVFSKIYLYKSIIRLTSVTLVS